MQCICHAYFVDYIIYKEEISKYQLYVFFDLLVWLGCIMHLLIYICLVPRYVYFYFNVHTVYPQISPYFQGHFIITTK